MDARPQAHVAVAAVAKPPVERLLGLSMLAVFATTLCMRAVDPVVPQIAEHFVVDPHTVALLATAFSLPYAITQPVLGGLADAFGKTRLMTLSLGALMLSAVLGAVAPDMPTLFASRVVSGIMAGGVFPIAVAIAADLVSFERRQVAVGRILSAAMIGNVLGSPLAGIAADLIGWRGVFVGMGALAGAAVVSTGFGFRGLRTSTAEPIEIASMPATYRAIFRHPLAKICFGSVMLEAICLHGLFPYVAQLLASAGEPRAAIAGLVIAGFGVGGIIYVALIALLLRLLHERGVMLTGGTLMGLGLMVVALRLPWPLQFVNFVVLGVGFYLLHGVIQIYASELAPQARGSAMAMHSTFFFFGNALGPVIYGLALSTLGLAATVIPFGAILIVVGIVCARTLRRDAG